MAFSGRSLRPVFAFVTLAALAGVAAAGPVSAQDGPTFRPPDPGLLHPVGLVSTHSFDAAPPRVPTPQDSGGGFGRNVVGPVIGGALGALAGFIPGGLLGASLENSLSPCHCEDPGLVGFIAGAIGGMALTVPVGVHIFDGRRGDLRAAVAGSVAGGIVAVVVGLSGNPAYGRNVAVAFAAAPVLETIGALMGEAATRGR